MELHRQRAGAAHRRRRRTSTSGPASARSSAKSTRTILQALGCVGVRHQRIGARLDGVRALGFQLLRAGVAVSHAFAHIVDFGEPVEVGGLAVATGDMLFGDATACCRCRRRSSTEIPRGRGRMQAQEERVIAFCRSPQFSIDGLRALVRDLG